MLCYANQPAPSRGLLHDYTIHHRQLIVYSTSYNSPPQLGGELHVRWDQCAVWSSSIKYEFDAEQPLASLLLNLSTLFEGYVSGFCFSV